MQESKAGQENKLSKTIMKKLFSLAMIAAVSFVLVGCQKSDEQKAKDAAADATKAGADAAKTGADAAKGAADAIKK